jgi:hypothetical protein
MLGLGNFNWLFGWITGFENLLYSIGLRRLFANQLYLIAALSHFDGNCGFAVVGVGFYVALLRWLESPPVVRRKMWMMTTTDVVTRLCLMTFKTLNFSFGVHLSPVTGSLPL